MKYENIKLKLFDEEFDGTMDVDYIKTFKSIDRNFMQISIMDLIEQHCSLIESLTTNSDSNVSENASLLISSIRNPKKYQFG